MNKRAGELTDDEVLKKYLSAKVVPDICGQHYSAALFLSLNSSPIDELGNLCLKCWQGSEHVRLRQGGIYGNPLSGNHPCKQLPTGTVTLKQISGKYSPDPHTYHKVGNI